MVAGRSRRRWKETMTLSERPITASDMRERRLHEFALALRRLRLNNGEPSLRTLVGRIGDLGGSLSVSSLAEIFNGRRLPTWESAALIAAALDADADGLRPLWDVATSVKRVSPTERQGEEFAKKYLSQIAAYSNQVPLPDSMFFRRPTLDNIYVEQWVTDIEGDKVPTLSLLEEDNSRIVLLGSPGAGKTTACRAIMYACTQSPSAPMPFFLTVREFFFRVPPEMSVVGMIEHVAETFFQARPPDSYVEKQLEEGRALVIFDGLDELSDVAAYSASSIIELFCRQFPRTKVIVTSRPVGYNRAPLDPTLFKLYTLKEFDSNQVREYLVKWSEFEETPASEIQDWVYASKDFIDIQSNPLLLSLAAQVYQSQGYLPRDTLDMLRHMAELILYKWDQRRGINVDTHARMFAGPMLSFLAFQMIDSDSEQLSEPELIDRFTIYLTDIRDFSVEEAGSVARDFSNFVLGRSMLLYEVGNTPTGEPIFMFAHRTFMEYFAARYIADSKDPAPLISRLLAKPERLGVLEFVLGLAEHRAPGAASRLLGIALDEVRDLNPEAREQAERYLAGIRLSRFDRLLKNGAAPRLLRPAGRVATIRCQSTFDILP
jgi:transcriptional regulator with XRE-family HTH domain